MNGKPKMSRGDSLNKNFQSKFLALAAISGSLGPLFFFPPSFGSFASFSYLFGLMVEKDLVIILGLKSSIKESF